MVTKARFCLFLPCFQHSSWMILLSHRPNDFAPHLKGSQWLPSHPERRPESDLPGLADWHPHPLCPPRQLLSARGLSPGCACLCILDSPGPAPTSQLPQDTPPQGAAWLTPHCFKFLIQKWSSQWASPGQPGQSSPILPCSPFLLHFLSLASEPLVVLLALLLLYWQSLPLACEFMRAPIFASVTLQRPELCFVGGRKSGQEGRWWEERNWKLFRKKKMRKGRREEKRRKRGRNGTGWREREGPGLKPMLLLPDFAPQLRWGALGPGLEAEIHRTLHIRTGGLLADSFTIYTPSSNLSQGIFPREKQHSTLSWCSSFPLVISKPFYKQALSLYERGNGRKLVIFRWPTAKSLNRCYTEVERVIE